PGGEGKHTKPREGEVRAFTMDEVPDFGIRAIDAIDSVMARPLTDAERFEVASVLRRENRFTIFAVPRFVSGNWRSLHAALAAILPEARRVAEQEAEEAENWDEWYKDGKTPQQRETAERIANMPKPEDVAHKWAAMLACTLPPPPEYVTRNMPKDGEP
ncbi:MAG: hypothetical protein KC613_07425, partial [Myxococcales bacterium]|nr:hypothetical protein [Myxococcales bacterium]